jgi:NADPH:quinone reductase
MTMQAAVIESVGDPATVLQLRTMPKPVPGRGQVLVRMIASPVNPSDLMYIRGVYGLKPNLPCTPGFEGVGIVEASGGGLLARMRMGQRVAVMNDQYGNWSEYTVTDAKKVIPVPDDIADDQAATFFINPATAYLLIAKVLAIPNGGTLLQTAAGSALGTMIIRLARARGIRTINIVRRAESVESLAKLGADHVIAATPETLVDQVKSIVSGGVMYAIDPVGGGLAASSVECLAPGGTLVCYGNLSGEPIRLDVRKLMTGSKSIRGFWLADTLKTMGIPSKLRLIRRIRAMIREGIATTPLGRSFPLADVAAAVDYAAEPGRIGKVLLRFRA